MSYTTTEKQEIERLRYESKVSVMKDIDARKETYSTAIAAKLATYNEDVMKIRTDAKAKLATDIQNAIESMRRLDTDTDERDDVTGGDDDE